jgi:hypothetical protein
MDKENCATKFNYSYLKAKSPKNLILEWPNFIAQWSIFTTKLAEKFCLELQHWGMLPWMKEERDNKLRRGGPPTLPSAQSLPQYISAFATRVLQSTHICVKGESLCPNFQTFQDPRHQFHGIGRLVSDLLFRGLFIASYAGGYDSLEIFALLKSLKIRALENYVCLLRHTFTDS